MPSKSVEVTILADGGLDSTALVPRRLGELEALGLLERDGTGAGSRYRVSPLHGVKKGQID